jgi:hypothetical protein
MQESWLRNHYDLPKTLWVKSQVILVLMISWVLSLDRSVLVNKLKIVNMNADQVSAFLMKSCAFVS